MKLTPLEQETILLYNQSEQTARARKTGSRRGTQSKASGMAETVEREKESCWSRETGVCNGVMWHRFIHWFMI